MRKRLVLLARLLGIGLAAMLALAWCAWLAGRVMSDRYAWSQWLAWIPTLAVLPIPFLGIALGLVSRRRRLIVATWCAVLLVTAITFFVIDHRYLHTARKDPGGFEIVQWTMSEPLLGKRERFVDFVSAIDADLTIGTNAGAAAFKPKLRAWLGEGHPPRLMSPFVILTREPVRTARYLVKTKDAISIVLLEIDTEAAGPLTIWLVDLPSDPELPRMELAERVRELLAAANAPEPDLMIGDFNTTRGSAALEVIAPGYRHAFDVGGHGYGATFHRSFPTVHIDHTLMGDGISCERYDLIDPGVGRHVAQRMWIVRDP